MMNGVRRQSPVFQSPVFLACVALIVAAQAVLWWRAFRWYPEIPQRFPTHFGADGKPNGWMDKNFFTWFMLPLLSLVMLAFFGGISAWLGWLVRKSPQIVNVPRKDLFLKMSVEGRMTIVRPTREFLAWVMALMMWLFAYILEGSARVAVHIDDTLVAWPLFIFMGGVLGVLPFYMIRTGRMLDDVARAEGIIPANK